jgi:hypothetical protein
MPYLGEGVPDPYLDVSEQLEVRVHRVTPSVRPPFFDPECDSTDPAPCSVDPAQPDQRIQRSLHPGPAQSPATGSKHQKYGTVIDTAHATTGPAARPPHRGSTTTTRRVPIGCPNGEPPPR